MGKSYKMKKLFQVKKKLNELDFAEEMKISRSTFRENKKQYLRKLQNRDLYGEFKQAGISISSLNKIEVLLTAGQ